MRKSIKIVRASYVNGYKLNLEFSDGKSQIVDFGYFIENSQHEDIRKYLDLKRFKKFKLENGDLMWGDFDLIFPLIDLYENNIEHDEKVSKTEKFAKAR